MMRHKMRQFMYLTQHIFILFLFIRYIANKFIAQHWIIVEQLSQQITHIVHTYNKYAMDINTLGSAKLEVTIQYIVKKQFAYVE